MKLVLSFLFLMITFTNLYSDDSFDDFEDEVKVEKPIDPLSGFNRTMTVFNDKTYRYVLSPVSKTYKGIVNKHIRHGIDNFFYNLLFPIRFVNNLLQLKFKNTLEETERFAINSTLGIFGFIDIASKECKIPEHNEDFGQTLGYWGVGSGFYIVWPFFGPSNLRDSIGSFGIDNYFNPTVYYEKRGYNIVDNYGKSAGVKVYNTINHTSLHESEYENFTKGAIDLYPFLRNSYEQYRKKQIEE